MAVAEVYRRQVALLVQALPHVAKESVLGLKGGTAINLFVRDLPRLSVDIDLGLPARRRPRHLFEKYRCRHQGHRGTLAQAYPWAEVTLGTLRPENVATKLTLRAHGVQVKVEVSPVLRGSVYDPRTLSVADTVERRTVTPR